MNIQVQPENSSVDAVQPQMPIANYHEFYRFYLTEHRHIVSRRLHVAGSSIGLYCFAKAIRQG
ncbi:MAG: Mpo1-like protein, partial [Acinetobacter sp.]